MRRTVVWFSCGAASAVAAKIAVKQHENVSVVYCDTGGEHPSNKKFLNDVQDWIGQEIIVLKNEKYINHFDVMRKHHYVNSPTGTMCTRKLKWRVRVNFQKDDDLHIFGFTLEERNRAERFDAKNPDLETEWILIDGGITKGDTLGMIQHAGIELPVMYQLGYGHNNCIGCPQGGLGYWNKIRKDFPEAFKEMAEIEREVRATCRREKDGSPIYLDTLSPDRGRYETEPKIECGIVCQGIYNQVVGDSDIDDDD